MEKEKSWDSDQFHRKIFTAPGTRHSTKMSIRSKIDRIRSNCVIQLLSYHLFLQQSCGDYQNGGRNKTVSKKNINAQKCL